MDLLVGLGVLVLLIFFTTVLAFLIEYVPKEVPQLLIAVMMVGDAALSGVYYYIGAEFVDDLQKFKSGIGLSFIIISNFYNSCHGDELLIRLLYILFCCIIIICDLNV